MFWNALRSNQKGNVMTILHLLQKNSNSIQFYLYSAFHKVSLFQSCFKDKNKQNLVLLNK